MKYSSKYQYGYQPKINYWKSKWNQAIEMGDVEGALQAEAKVEYFTNRQKTVYGQRLGRLVREEQVPYGQRLGRLVRA